MLIALIVSPAGAVNFHPASAPAGTFVASRRTSPGASPDVAALPPVTSVLPQLALVSRYVVLLLNGSHELLTSGAVPAHAVTGYVPAKAVPVAITPAMSSMEAKSNERLITRPACGRHA